VYKGQGMQIAGKLYLWPRYRYNSVYAGKCARWAAEKTFITL